MKNLTTFTNLEKGGTQYHERSKRRNDCTRLSLILNMD